MTWKSDKDTPSYKMYMFWILIVMRESMVKVRVTEIETPFEVITNFFAFRMMNQSL